MLSALLAALVASAHAGPDLPHSAWEAAPTGALSARVGPTAEVALSARGLRARPSTATSWDAAVGLRLVAWGPPDALNPVGPAQPEATALVETAVAERPGLTEWWVALPSGLEHGWTLDAPPAPADPAGRVALEIGLESIARVRVDTDRTGATLWDNWGRTWRYDSLVAWDADGAPVPAYLSAEDAALIVTVDTRGAAWPLTVDPLLSNTEDRVLLASDPESGVAYGWSVAGAGDLDGNGYDDAVVATISTGSSGDSAAYVYYGGPEGLELASEKKLSAHYGQWARGGGDLNDDGYDDLLVADDNAARLYLGGPSGLENDAAQSLPGASRADAAGDLNGDGLDDAVVLLSNGATAYFGGSNGPTAGSTFSPSSFLSAIAGAGDVDGDGYDDVLLGAKVESPGGVGTGAAYIVFSGDSGPQENRTQQILASDGEGGDGYGASVDSAGDVDGDGRADVIVGAPYNAENGVAAGAAYVLLGSEDGADSASETKLLPRDVLADLLFGTSVAGAGDVDANGYDDVAVGSSRGYDLVGYKSGVAYVFLGDDGGVSPSDFVWLYAGQGALGNLFGQSVAGIGDVNGDGAADLLVGVPSDAIAATDAGSASVFLGCIDEQGNRRCDGDVPGSDAPPSGCGCAASSPGAPLGGSLALAALALVGLARRRADAEPQCR